MAFPLIPILMAASTAASAGMSYSAGRKQSAAQQRQAAIELLAAQHNAAIYRNHALVHEGNAGHAEEIAGFNMSMAMREAGFNERVSAVEQQWRNHYAGLMLRQGEMQQRAFNQAAKSRELHGREAISRMERGKREIVGTVRARSAASGVQHTGSPLLAAVETARRAELQKLDEFTRTKEDAANLRYEGEKALYEAQTGAAWQQWQAQMTRLIAMNDVVNTRLQGWIGMESALQEARNLRSQAQDSLRQAELTLLYGESGYQGSMAMASATRTANSAQLLGGVASVGNTWQNSYTAWQKNQFTKAATNQLKTQATTRSGY